MELQLLEASVKFSIFQDTLRDRLFYNFVSVFGFTQEQKIILFQFHFSPKRNSFFVLVAFRSTLVKISVRFPVFISTIIGKFLSIEKTDRFRNTEILNSKNGTHRFKNRSGDNPQA